MAYLEIFVSGKRVVSREVDAVECEETAGGTLDLHATFPPIDMSDSLPTGTPLRPISANIIASFPDGNLIS